MSVDSRGVVERVWFGRDALAIAARMALVPAERLFAGVVGARDILYDAGWLPAEATSIPVVSVGNLTVGGTGKTPIAAWLAQGLVARGAKPAVILRGYGADEPLVHARLNPGVSVVVNVDRHAAVEAAARAGADVAVLDDGFQHRRVQRVADLVLVSADRWTPDMRLLPAGPWREPLRAVRRATLVIVTRKAASEAEVELVHEQIASVAPAVPRVSVRLAPGELVGSPDGAVERLDALHGQDVHAVVSIADPQAFRRQLEALGAHVHLQIFPDHHAFTAEEVGRIARAVPVGRRVICTLKDLVKLEPLWPRLGPPLWYVSQRVLVERGVGGLERVLDELTRARPGQVATAG